VSDDLPVKLPPVNPSTADVPATDLTPELLAGLLADGDDELAAWALRHALAETPRAAVFDGLLRDAMALVGERWRSGQWTIAEEHLASRTLLRALEQIRPPMRPELRVGPLAVLAGVAGEQHMIGLVCLEQVLAEAGWTVANLGADLPSADLAQFVRRNEVNLVAVSANGSDRRSALADTVLAVRVAAGGARVPVIVGGGIVSDPDIKDEVDADAAVRSLAEALAFADASRGG
jgi:MerR family transcriptional regulator, light-induced transcriptional regulator